jgi:cytochrome d ubiquinol oxidase subunit II
MFRGIAMELRNHFVSEIWHQFWDAAFTISSALLIFVFGLTLGNLLRGVPLDAAGYFEGTFAFLLNPYAVLVGLFALAALGVHGAAFAAMRIEGDPGDRAIRLLRVGFWFALAFYAVVTALTLSLHPASRGWLLAMPVFSLTALLGLWWYARRGRAAAAFAMTTSFVATLLAAWAGTLFPYVVPAYPWGRGGITIFAAAPSSAGVSCALAVAVVGVILVAIYAPIAWRRMAGKVRVE